MKKSDVKYGLMVIDGRQEDDEAVDVIHFVGYAEKPNKVDADNLREELRTDSEFGLTEIADHLVILPATKKVLDYYLKILNDGE